MQDDYIRFRCSLSQKLSIQSRASDLGISVTDYILRSVRLEMDRLDAADQVMLPVSRRLLEDLLKVEGK